MSESMIAIKFFRFIVNLHKSFPFVSLDNCPVVTNGHGLAPFHKNDYDFIRMKVPYKIVIATDIFICADLPMQIQLGKTHEEHFAL